MGRRRTHNQAFWRVRTLRDLVATGATVDQKEFRQLLDEYIAAAEDAQVAMRKDLGTSWKRDHVRIVIRVIRSPGATA
jgi:hypothetical protein